jgi:hypothetical protein
MSGAVGAGVPLAAAVSSFGCRSVMLATRETHAQQMR